MEVKWNSPVKQTQLTQLLGRAKKLRNELPQDFLALEEQWQGYFEAKQSEEHAANKMHMEFKMKSSSSWNLQSISRFVKAFALLSWRTNESISAFKMESLEDHLQAPSESFEPLDTFQVQLHPTLRDEEWKTSYLDHLNLALQVLGSPIVADDISVSKSHPIEINKSKLGEFFACEKSPERTQELLKLLTAHAGKNASAVNLTIAGLSKKERQQLHIATSLLAKDGQKVQSKSSSDDTGSSVLHLWMETRPKRVRSPRELDSLPARSEVFSRLAGLSDLQGHEACSRVVIDAIMFPLCARLQAGLGLEAATKLPIFPTSICDYVIYSSKHGKALGVVEAKRCTPNWAWTLSQGIAQCVWQLATLHEAQKHGP